MRVLGPARPGFLLLAALAAAFALLARLAAAESAPASEAGGRSVEEIERIVRDYLLAHPELLLEVQQALQAKMRAQQEAQDREAIAAHATALFLDPEAPVGGNPDGTITLVEFFDYRCPHCRRAQPVIERVIATNADLRIVYKELPILGEESVLAARAALAARPQGRYDAFHAALMQTDGPFTEARLMEIAQAAGLDTERLAADMADPAIDAIIAANRRLAERLGISGTPNFVTGEHIIRGALGLEQFQALLAELRLAQAEEAE